MVVDLALGDARNIVDGELLEDDIRGSSHATQGCHRLRRVRHFLPALQVLGALYTQLA